MNAIPRNNIVSGQVTNRRDHVPFRTSTRKFVKRAAIIAALTFLAMLALGMTLNATSDKGKDPLPRCESEWATHCYWDASVQGNGHGHDFVRP